MISTSLVKIFGLIKGINLAKSWWCGSLGCGVGGERWGVGGEDNGEVSFGGLESAFELVGFEESLVLLALLQVLLDDLDLAAAVHFESTEIPELQIDELEYLALDFLLVGSPHELAVAGHILPFQHQHQQLEKLLPYL